MKNTKTADLSADTLNDGSAAWWVDLGDHNGTSDQQSAKTKAEALKICAAWVGNGMILEFSHGELNCTHNARNGKISKKAYNPNAEMIQIINRAGTQIWGDMIGLEASFRVKIAKTVAIQLIEEDERAGKENWCLLDMGEGKDYLMAANIDPSDDAVPPAIVAPTMNKISVTKFDVAQICINGNWMDYSTLRTPGDLVAIQVAHRKGKDCFRISISSTGETCTPDAAVWAEPAAHLICD